MIRCSGYPVHPYHRPTFPCRQSQFHRFLTNHYCNSCYDSISDHHCSNVAVFAFVHPPSSDDCRVAAWRDRSDRKCHCWNAWEVRVAAWEIDWLDGCSVEGFMSDLYLLCWVFAINLQHHFHCSPESRSTKSDFDGQYLLEDENKINKVVNFLISNSLYSPWPLPSLSLVLIMPPRWSISLGFVICLRFSSKKSFNRFSSWFFLLSNVDGECGVSSDAFQFHDE